MFSWNATREAASKLKKEKIKLIGVIELTLPETQIGSVSRDEEKRGGRERKKENGFLLECVAAM